LSIPSRATQILAADWVSLLENKLIKTAQVMGFNSLGLWIMAVDANDRLRAYVLTDVTAGAQQFTFDNQKQLEVSLYDSLGNAVPTVTSQPGSTTRSLVTRIIRSGVTDLIVQLATGSVVQLKSSVLSGYNQISVGNTATLIGSPTQGSFFHVKNIDPTTDCFVGLDANVTTTNGYPLKANQVGPQSELFFFNTGLSSAIYGITAAVAASVAFISV
jgi:hypothetical protein